MKILKPKFNYSNEVTPFMQALSDLDVNNTESSGGQMNQFVKILAFLCNYEPSYLASLIRYGVHEEIANSIHQMNLEHSNEITPIMQAACKLDDKKEESDGGQMLELLKHTATLFNKYNFHLASVIRYGEHFKNQPEYNEYITKLAA